MLRFASYLATAPATSAFSLLIASFLATTPATFMCAELQLLLTEEEREVYQRLIDEIYPEVSEMITNPLTERGRQEGIQQGRQQGRQQELQESIVRILSHRFRQIPQDLQEKISSLTNIEKLRNLLDASVEVKSLEELRMDGFFDG